MSKKKKKSTKRPKVNFPELLIGGLIDLIVAVIGAYIISKVL